jgi:hypothetical protein
MTPAGFALPAVYEGATWEGINLITLTNRQSGRPINLRDAEIDMVYRRVGEKAERLSFGVGAGITILSAGEGKLRVDPQILPLPAGPYYFELIAQLAAGSRLPILAGTQAITRLGVPS